MFNHETSSLSEMDLEMIKYIPPGGNWKDIPLSIPSKRLERIRADYEKGLGSRSTYYGRLEWDKPSYTITTYFNRPGNGCYIHPRENRLISLREGARLQSFPDDFEFLGSRTSIYKQIGNAVPPLLSYQISNSLKKVVNELTNIDLFCGAGGLSYGFHLSGWETVSAADNNKDALKTYNRNFGPVGQLIDLSDEEDRNKFIVGVKEKLGGKELGAVVGGPPCQGFSTAGNRRFLEDPRNQLFGAYLDVFKQLRPHAFIMENVTGILSMGKGEVIHSITKAFEEAGYHVEVYKVNAALYGVPQKRVRVIIVGTLGDKRFEFPEPLLPNNPLLDQSYQPVTVRDAIAGMPPLGGNSAVNQSIYSRFMSGTLSIEAFLRDIKSEKRNYSLQLT